MDDDEVLSGIQRLAKEEHGLFEKESKGTITADEQERLAAVQVGLDRCWDLLRQRRALRAVGANPDSARERDERTVEGYTG